MKQGSRIVQYLATFVVSIAAVTQGISSAWPTPVLAKLHDNETDIRITDAEISWVVAMSSPGFIAGSVVTRYTADRFGRKATLCLSAIPVTLGTIVVIFAKVPWLLYITRFLWGNSTGFISIIAGMYVAEISNKEIRGTLTLVTRFMFHFGTLLVMAIGSFVSYNTLNYMLLVLPICYFIACWWIPESPYYHLKEGKVEKARTALAKLRGFDDKAMVEEELQHLQADVRKEMLRKSTMKELFMGKPYRKAVIIAAGLKITQLMAGTLTIQQYLGRIMQESDTNMKLSTAFIIFGGVRFLVGIMSSVLADRVGRRPLLIYSYLGTALSLFVVGTYFFLQQATSLDPKSLAPYSLIPFIGIIFASVISTVGFNSIGAMIPSEIFPMNVKAIALTCLNIFGGSLSFSMSRGYQIIKDYTGLCGVFWIFALMSFVGSIFSAVCVPETKGKSLREIQIILQGDAYNDVEEKDVTDKFLSENELKEIKT